ncbi:MAG: hypothetical protein ABI467_30820 [Kofleriaceae bacterium]
MVKPALLGLLALVACQTHGSAPRNETGSAVPVVAADAHAPRAGDEVAAAARGGIDEPGLARRGSAADEPDPAPDPGKQIYALGAVPAWQAVVDRSLYLERRDQHGVVYGTLGDGITMVVPGSGSGSASAAIADGGTVQAPTPYTWLIDDTEGNGCLAIRVALPDGTKVKPGDRVALAGAWALDADRHWFWKPTLVTLVAPAPPSKAKEPPSAPGHTIINGELPAGARPISLAKEGQAAYFTVLGAPPLADGDGWQVADELGNPVYALLDMPGERASFGAQDMRTADERWTLKRAQTYWVRIGPVHKHGPDKPATIHAHTAPIRVK